MRPRNILPAPTAAVLAAVLAAVSACASAPGAGTSDTLRARLAGAAPTLDGVADDAAWNAAAWLVAPLTRPAGTPGPTEVHVAAAVTGDEIHVCVRWADTTEDREYKPWTYADGAWKAGSKLEDVVAVAFPIAGEFTADMESPVDCVWDVWHWKAGRTDPAGFAMDKSHVNTMADPGGKRHEAKLPDGRALYIVRPEDAGTSATRTIKAPSGGAGTAVAQYVAQTPAGSAADVRARGVWKDGWWTVEMTRKLDTGNADDAKLAHGVAIPFALAILDHAADEAHATTGKLTLEVE